MFVPVGKAKAIEVAREECERRGQPFLPEIKVYSNLLWYTVVTRAQTIGGSAYIRVGKRTGKVVSYWYVRR